MSSGGPTRTGFQTGGGQTRAGFGISRPKLTGSKSESGGVIQIGPPLIGTINGGPTRTGFQSFVSRRTCFGSRRETSAWTRTMSTGLRVCGHRRPDPAVTVVTGPGPSSRASFPAVLTISARQEAASRRAVPVHCAGSVARRLPATDRRIDLYALPTIPLLFVLVSSSFDSTIYNR